MYNKEQCKFTGAKGGVAEKATTILKIWSGFGEKYSSILWVITQTLIRFCPNFFFLNQIQEDIALECSTALIELLTKDMSPETGWLDFEFWTSLPRVP